MLAFALEDAAAQKDAVVRGPKKGPYAASAIVLDGLFLPNANLLLPSYTVSHTMVAELKSNVFRNEIYHTIAQPTRFWLLSKRSDFGCGAVCRLLLVYERQGKCPNKAGLFSD